LDLSSEEAVKIFSLYADKLPFVLNIIPAI